MRNSKRKFACAEESWRDIWWLFTTDDYDASLEDAAMERDIDVLNDEMVAAGVRIFVGGLRPASSAKSVRAQPDGKVLVTDGPYLETKEHIGGFWVVEAADMNEALGWGRKAAVACRAPVEVRPFGGAIQAPSGPKEDPGYPYGGWAVPFSDPAAGAAIVAAHREAFDLLLGRRTYDIWSGFWPKAPKSPMADSINAATKYVATHRPKSLGWGPVEDLGPDIVEGICRVKAKDGPDLIVWGSSTLTSVWLEHGLADEILPFVFPVLLGTGKRLFSEGTPPRELALVSTKAVSSGVIISTYRPSGHLRTGNFGDTAA